MTNVDVRVRQIINNVMANRLVICNNCYELSRSRGFSVALDSCHEKVNSLCRQLAFDPTNLSCQRFD